ncbi:hypothetical protein [Brevundimonas lenta]|uniref:Uncharacterized protein n=1 Tax=Brevundimonas lenta TaxID=424796 RepID=A0A7W6JAA1_9CAUL|nr:hypothetical protein [Brevundimonas lenta]MBB4081426.1 hypothetical protein [Brevundimonas lenta]
MDLDEDYLRGLSGSSVEIRKFLVGRFTSALKATRAAGLIVEFDEEDWVGASMARVVSSVAIAAATDLETVEHPSGDHQDAVETLVALSELLLLWEELALTSPLVVHEPLARVMLLSKALAHGEAVQYVQTERLLEKAVALDQDRARRRSGGLATTARRAEDKQALLKIARSIVSANAALSNEDLAIKLHGSGRRGSALTVRTLTEWVRSWRRDGMLQAKR